MTLKIDFWQTKIAAPFSVPTTSIHRRRLKSRRAFGSPEIAASREWCTAKVSCGAARIVRQMWHIRSLIVQAKCGTFIVTGRFIRRPLPDQKGDAMKKTLMALAAVATLAVSTLAAPAPAQAQRGVGAAIAGGLIGGAIVGGALAGPYGYGPGYYGPGYGYYGGGGPAYVAGPGYYGDCYWQRQRFWDGYGWQVRRVRVCG
jgi:hypothetical protein